MLRAGAVLTFTSYAIQDTNITLSFVCADPGPGEPSDYEITVTDAELALAIGGVQVRTLITDKLKRKLRAQGLATKLNAAIGAQITID